MLGRGDRRLHVLGHSVGRQALPRGLVQSPLLARHERQRRADVFHVAINDAGNNCDTATWRSLADSAATTAGANLSLYQHRLYVLPSTVACQWAGYAQIGCGSACWAMVSTCDRGDVYAHELGHNLGMYHASFDVNDDGAVDGTCPWGGWSGGGEYCDDSDFMGISTNVWRQTNGPHKSQWRGAGGKITTRRPRARRAGRSRPILATTTLRPPQSRGRRAASTISSYRRAVIRRRDARVVRRCTSIHANPAATLCS